MDDTRKRLKELVDELCDATNVLASQANIEKDAGKVARFEFAKFMMYLSASDGTIEWDEVNAISDICGYRLSPSELGEFIRNDNIYSTKFEQTVPITFQLLIKIDEIMKDMGIAISASENMLDTYKAVGALLIESDGNKNEKEVADYKTYINMLEEYRDKKLNGGGGVSGFTKNTGAATEPIKNGVSAPRKG